MKNWIVATGYRVRPIIQTPEIVLPELFTQHSPYSNCPTFKFGDSRELCDRLLALVRAGKKTATCGALRDYQAEGESLPAVGRIDIALTWDGEPAIAIRTTEMTQKRFCDVGESFALAEGENDTLAGWQADHQAFFERNSGFDPEMILACERFELVEDFG